VRLGFRIGLLLLAVSFAMDGGTVPPVFAENAIAAAKQDDVAIDFARAYLDQATYVDRFRAALHDEVATCAAANQLTANEASEKNAFYDRYMDIWASKFPDIQNEVAATLRGSFNEVQLTELDTFYRSPTGRKIVVIIIDQLVSMLAKSTPACGAPLPSIDKAKLVSAAMSQLSPAEIAEISAFGTSDAGHKFHEFQPTLMAVLGPLLRDSKTAALAAASLKKEAK